MVEGLPLEKMKEYCKKNNCTINDYTTALLSNTIYEYMSTQQVIDGKEFRIPECINIGMPFSLRQPCKSIKDFKINNDLVAIPTEIKIFSELKKALVHFNKQFKQMRNSLDPFGVYAAFSLTVNFPYTLSRVGLDFITTKYTMAYTNLNASKVPYVWDGKKQKGAYYFAGTPGDLCCCVSLLTTGPFMSFGCFSDRDSIRYP